MIVTKEVFLEYKQTELKKTFRAQGYVHTMEYSVKK